jgi:hypothetical protein
MMLVKSRHKVVKNPVDNIKPPYQKVNKLLLRNFEKLIKVPDMTDHMPDGFKVLESKEYVIGISDAYAFTKGEVSFFNRGLYLESMFGKDVCTVSHLHFGSGYNICLGCRHESCWNRNADCCEYGCHRGHLILIKIKKDFCNTRFTTAFETMSRVLPSWNKYTFIEKHGIPVSNDYDLLFRVFDIHNPNKRMCI